MNINNLFSMLSQNTQKDVYSNGDARITQASKIGREDFLAGTHPSVIYHGSEDYSFPKMGGESPEFQAKLTVIDPEWERKQLEALRLLGMPLSNASGTLRYAYEAVARRLPQELMEKDWGFSVSDGSLVFTAGNDPLSEQELELLNDAFSTANVEFHANEVASVIVRAIELNRAWGDDGLSKGFGRYDVTKENFSEIVDLRAYLLSHGPDGKYGKCLNDPTDYNRLYVTGSYAMLDQIFARAVPRFAKE